jgi:hypothetical protein
MALFAENQFPENMPETINEEGNSPRSDQN